MLKSKVQEFESVVKEKEEVLTQNNELKSVLNAKDKKISAQQAKIHDLSLLLQTEKKKSRSVISKLMSDAEAVIAEAHDISFEADSKVASVSQTLDRIKQKHRVSLMKERQHNSSQLEKKESEHEVIAALDKAKYDDQLDKVKTQCQAASALKQAKHDDQLNKMEMKYQTAAASDKARYDKKIQSLQNRLEAAMQGLDKKKLLWEAKLAQANTELGEAKDEVYVQNADIES
eukprot:scaffold311707_cov83-Cyclotella_meneghiniana.AAC.2